MLQIHDSGIFLDSNTDEFSQKESNLWSYDHYFGCPTTNLHVQQTRGNLAINKVHVINILHTARISMSMSPLSERNLMLYFKPAE